MAKAKKVRSVQIGASIVPIKFVKLADSAGAFDEPTMEILINTDAPPSLVNTTIFHEILHAISYAYGMSLSEHDVLILENTLLPLLQDNPWLLDDKVEAD